MISRRQSLQRLTRTGVGATAASASLSAVLWHTPAFATQFLDLAQAQKLLLPQAQTFAPLAWALDAALLTELAAASQSQIPRGYAPSGWSGAVDGKRVGWVLFDRAIGKYELIDYAMGFMVDGTSTGLEVMAYRESHGAEIRNAAWRKQFAGRKGAGQLRFGDDIRNISGATLSCQHVTQGAQRLGVLAQWLSQDKIKA